MRVPEISRGVAMPEIANRRIVMASRPDGMPGLEHFRLETAAPPQPGAGEIQCRTLYLSLDPYMRVRMRDEPGYAAATEIGGVMEGGTVGQVLESNFPGISVGDFVEGRGGWQEYWTLPGDRVRKIDPDAAPLSTALGILGMPGMTAYVGLLEIGRPKEGDTLVVAAASGAVGSAVGQIAKIKGCRVVGIARGSEKCAYVKNDLGFDDCLDHRLPGLADRLRDACPEGIDIYFENVGHPVFEAVLGLLNPFARIPICGAIAHYNAAESELGPDVVPQLLRDAVFKRLTLTGFLVRDFAHKEVDFLCDVAAWLASGRLKYREDFIDGLENAPAGLIGLLQGLNFGKVIVRVAPDPTRP